jgi:outer membrane protein OmpA-like peptidoglycan-associated protein
MTFRHVRRCLYNLSMYALVGLFATGCATLAPQDPPALTAIHQANDAMLASKKAGAADRFPDEFADLEKRYQLTRGTFYACQEDKALGMAQALIADFNALASKRVMVAKPPPPPPPANQSPLALFKAPSEGDVGISLTFDASASSDPDGDTLTYKWDFGDGEMASFTSPIATHRYAKVGNYNARLVVDDGRGGTDTASSLVQVVSRQVIQSDVLFDIDKAILKPQGEQVLADIVQQMQDNSSYQAELVGHTDSTGTAKHNMGLSQRRAETVRDFLTARGISAQRITTDWKGETEPTAPNTTREGRKKNRRTEITLNPMPAMK